MKIENQVCTWQQGLRLKELGIQQSGYFTWMECLISNDGDHIEKHWRIHRPNTGEYDFVAEGAFPDWYDGDEYETGREASAFTVAELLEMLPHHTSLLFDGDDWRCETDAVFGEMLGITAAQSLSAQLISLLEINYITPEAANQRLKQ